MMTRACTAMPKYYQSCVPSFIADQIEKIRGELVFCIQKLYVGGSAYRFNGEGSEYLKSKSVYIAPNTWDLGHSLVIYSAFAALGYLMISLGSLWMGYGVITACCFFALGETVENYSGNHLEKALEQINPFDSLNTIEWKHSTSTRKITIDPKQVNENMMKGVDQWMRTQIVIFKLPPPPGTFYKQLIKIYYIGSEQFVRSHETIDGVRVECNNLLHGLDIQSLLDAVKSE